jgi:glutamyl-tRNA reductase
VSLALLGLSHRTAPVEVRERYALPAAALREHNQKLVSEPACDEVALLSTCNRTELLVVAEELAPALECAHAFFVHGIGEGAAEPTHLYELRDAEAVRHVFRVASGLESMVLGEAQILGQLKQAYRAAGEARACGPVLNHLFQRAFRTAKRVRTETGLGDSSVSVARVGVQLAAEIFETFAGKRVLLIGAGEMAESALHGFRDAGASDLVVLNRTYESAAGLSARFGARPAALDALEIELAQADIALTSVRVDQPLLGRADLERCLVGRQGRPLLLVDLGLPRNVDSRVDEIDDVYRYDLDDLDAIASDGLARRRDAVAPAEAIVSREVRRFERWILGLDAVPVIRELQELAEAVVRDEVRRTERGPEQREALARMAQAVVGKLLHGPLVRLREEAEEGAGAYYAAAVREIFGLAEDDD